MIPTPLAAARWELEDLTAVRAELDRCETKAEITDGWKRHYPKIGHRKLGRLLLGRPIDEIVKAKE